MKNVLLTSAGRRVSLLRAFRKELRHRLPEGRVLAADVQPELSPACRNADHALLVPRVSESEYPAVLLKLCKAHDIGVVVPCIDTELQVLAENRERFEADGVHVIISDPALIADCRDKRRTADLLQRYRLVTPAIFSKDDLTFPCFAKPYDGSSSSDTFLLRSKNDLTREIIEHPTLMFMEYRDLAMHDEVTIDLYYDCSHRLRCVVPRLRLEVRSGEVSKAVTQEAAYLELVKTNFSKLPGARGCLTLQIFVDHDSHDVYGIEVNPRFGGGYPLSYLAGANFPGWIIDEYLLGKEIKYFDSWERDLLMLRYDDEVIAHGY